MAGAFPKFCSKCKKEFREGDKAVIDALVRVTSGGRPTVAGSPIRRSDVQIRFHSGSRRVITCTTCAYSTSDAASQC